MTTPTSEVLAVLGGGAAVAAEAAEAPAAPVGDAASAGVDRVWHRPGVAAYRHPVLSPRPFDHRPSRARARLAAASVALMLVALGLSTGAAIPAAASPASALAVAAPMVTVSPDPSRDLYAGTGGLVVPAKDWRGSSDGRTEAASCGDCQWRVTELCTKAEFAAGGCRAIHIGCPVDTTPVRIWLLRPGAGWAVVGQACQGPGRPVTLAEVGRSVRDRAEKVLPPLRAAAQPADGALIGVPVVLRSGQPGGGIRAADLSVLGLDVRLDSRVRWQWVYGDGTTVWTSLPGGAYPDMSVRHTYRREGAVSIVVVALWRAQYTVEGLGPFAVPGPPLTQSQSLPVVVRAARARLVG